MKLEKFEAVVPNLGVIFLGAPGGGMGVDVLLLTKEVL